MRLSQPAPFAPCPSEAPPLFGLPPFSWPLAHNKMDSKMREEQNICGMFLIMLFIMLIFLNFICCRIFSAFPPHPFLFDLCICTTFLLWVEIYEMLISFFLRPRIASCDALFNFMAIEFLETSQRAKSKPIQKLITTSKLIMSGKLEIFRLPSKSDNKRPANQVKGRQFCDFN